MIRFLKEFSMSDSTNPYKSPRTDPSGQEFAGSLGAITEPMITYMKEASPWIRFIAIYGFIMAGFYILGGAIVAALWPMMTSLMTEADLAEAGLGSGFLGIFGGMGLFMVAFGVVMIFPLRYLYNFGSKLRTFVQTSNESALEIAFKNNKSFWKFCGILTIILMALIPAAYILIISFALL